MAVSPAAWDRGFSLLRPVTPARGDHQAAGAGFEFDLPAGGFLLSERILAHELLTYLPDVQLTKVDRASMLSSVEARVPLLDHRVVEFGMRLPVSLKIRGGTRKLLLQQVLYPHVTAELFGRPKMGFHLPLSSWLRGPPRRGCWSPSRSGPSGRSNSATGGTASTICGRS